MLPILLRIGPVTIYAFPIFLGVAFFFLGYFYWSKGKEEHYQEEELFDVFLQASVVGVVASRLAFILFHLDRFGADGLKWLNMFRFPGMLPLFGLVAAAWWIFSSAKRRKWDAFEVLDFTSIGVAFASMVTWLGLFFDGTSFGNTTTLPWGMRFPLVFDQRHPTQLYAAFLYALLFSYLYWVESEYRTFEWYRDKRHSAQSGFVFCVFCIFYGVFGALLSLLMPSQMSIAGVALDIPIRIMVMIFGAMLLFVRAGRSFRAVK